MREEEFINLKLIKEYFSNPELSMAELQERIQAEGDFHVHSNAPVSEALENEDEVLFYVRIVQNKIEVSKCLRCDHDSGFWIPRSLDPFPSLLRTNFLGQRTSTLIS